MTTLRLNMPQWQGGNDPCYHLGSQLLSFLAPDGAGPVETVAVPPPGRHEVLAKEDGIVARRALLDQAWEARKAIEKHNPHRIVTLGGDCLVSLAPMAWLSEKYGPSLGVLWIDAHPDVTTAGHYPHAHAYVLGLLLGQGDQEFRREVRRLVDPAHVAYAGLDRFVGHEGEVIDRLGLTRFGTDALANGSASVVDWISRRGITHLAVHFDLDVLDPKHFRPELFNMPDLPGTFADVARGRLLQSHVVKLLKDAATVSDVVGLTIAEHMPWDMLSLRDMLAELPLLRRE